MSPAVSAIEARRRALGLSQAELEHIAGLSRGYLWRLANGRYRPRVRTIAALELALARAGRRQTRGEAGAALAWRQAVALVALATGGGIQAAAAAQREDPALRATQAPGWRRAAELRRLAAYLLHCGLGLSQAEIAAAAGMTKQAISLAIRDVEDRRSDPGLDRLLDDLVAAIAPPEDAS